jgi:hypothetical protein
VPAGQLQGTNGLPGVGCYFSFDIPQIDLGQSLNFKDPYYDKIQDS